MSWLRKYAARVYYNIIFGFYDKLLYRRLTKLYDAFFRFDSSYAEGHRIVLEGLDKGYILDVACGTGTLMDLANEKGLLCCGLDQSEGMLNQSRSKNPNVELIRGDFENIPFNDSSFDYVVSTNAIGSVKVNPGRVLSEMIRVCKPRGEVRIADYGEPARKTFKNRMLIKLFKLLGDTPYDYQSILSEFGYMPSIEIIGLSGMYQFVRINK